MTPNPKKLIFDYSSKELHFFFFLLWKYHTQLSVTRQNTCLARTLHLVLIALRGFSVYIIFSLVFLCRRLCTVLSASHAQYAHSTVQEPGHQATADKRHEQRTGAGKGRERSQAKGGGFCEREKEGTTASSHRDGEQQRSKLTSR